MSLASPSPLPKALVVVLNWKRVTAKAAGAAIAVGLLTGVVLEFLNRQAFFPSLPQPSLPPGVLPSTVALAPSFTTLFGVTLLTRSEPIDEDIEAVMEVKWSAAGV